MVDSGVGDRKRIMVTTQMATSPTNVPLARPQDAVPRPSMRRTEHRQVVYRVLLGSEGRARRLASIAGACRFVWNELLDQQEQLHTMARMCGGRTPSPTFFTMGKAFTDLRRVTPWLQDMPYAPVRYTLKHQADAWRRFFDGAVTPSPFRRMSASRTTGCGFPAWAGWRFAGEVAIPIPKDDPSRPL